MTARLLRAPQWRAARSRALSPPLCFLDRGTLWIEEILSDRKLKALILDDFDDEAADRPLT
jgi:hypothetical protein